MAQVELQRQKAREDASSSPEVPQVFVRTRTRQTWSSVPQMKLRVARNGDAEEEEAADDEDEDDVSPSDGELSDRHGGGSTSPGEEVRPQRTRISPLSRRTYTIEKERPGSVSPTRMIPPSWEPQRIEVEREIQHHKVLAELEIGHLRAQVSALRRAKEKLERQHRAKCAAEQEAVSELKRLKTGHAGSQQQLVAEAKREALRAAREISRLEANLQQREHELVRIIGANNKLTKEKETLIEKLVRWKNERTKEVTNTLNKKAVTERERSLVRKTTTLTNQINRLERQCKALQVENDNLRKQMELEKERPRSAKERLKEEKELKILKKKNSELNSTAKQLQEKIKSLEQETMKKPQLMKTIDSLKKDFQRQRSKEQSEHAQSLVTKDKEIESLRQRCEELGKKLKDVNTDITIQNGRMYHEGIELEKILQQAAKERLQLEHQLSLLTVSLQNEVSKLQPLEENNRYLQERLEQLKEEHQHVVEQLEGKSDVCESLRQRFTEKAQLCADLEHQLHRALERNTELTVINTDLETQLQELQHVNEECQELRNSLGTVESEYQSAKLEVDSLQGKVDNLESVLRQMREAAEKRKELEKEHAEALQQLQQRQEDVKKLSRNQETERQKNLEIIENLQSKLRELEKKCELQNVRHEELVLEMTSIKRTHSKASYTCTTASTTPTTTTSSASLNAGGVNTTSSTASTGDPAESSRCSSVSQESQTSPENTSSAIETSMNRPIATPVTGAYMEYNSMGVSANPIGSTTVTTTYSTAMVSGSMATTATMSSFLPSYHLPSTGMMSYTTSTPYMGTSITAGTSPMPVPSLRSSSPLPMGMGMLRSASPLPMGTATSAEIDRIMAKIEQDNKILAELDKTRATIAGLGSSYGTSPSTSMVGLKSMLNTDTTYMGSTAYQLAQGVNPLAGTSLVSLSGTNPSILGSSAMTSAANSIPTIITTSYENDVAKALIGALKPSLAGTGLTQQPDAGDNQMDRLEIPGRGRVQVFVARYSYDPLQHSPNENPEAELAVNAGDYILVSGGMDEDGFYDGELLNGKRGLVPSNFVEKLTGEDLIEFQNQVLYGARESDDGSIGPTQDLEFNSDDSQMLIDEYRKAIDLSYLDLEDMEEEAEVTGEHGEGPVPAPQKLTLERQLHKSILISWSAPECPQGAIESYDVYVDGVLKTSVKATERTRALLEGVDSNLPHRISVRSVTPNKRTSRDAACTMVIGRDVPVAPSCVRAMNVTATSAVISWLPSNSNYQHVVCVNNVEVRVVKPGVYRHTITGLSPNTTYRVTVRVKNIKVPMVEDKPAKKLELISSYVDFKTLQVGLPDPPLDIQVEAGPQDGTLLVTWLPVTINTTGTSNGAPVTGYAVYADGKKVIDIDSPTGDHALLELAQLQGSVPKAITVRTKSHDSLSPDSMATKVPNELVKGSKLKQKTGPIENSSPGDSGSDSELVELFTQSARNTLDPLELTIYGFQKCLVEDFGDDSTDRSELSDIAEEAEEDLSDIEAEGKDQPLKDSHMRDHPRDHGRDQRSPARGPIDPRNGPDRPSGRRDGGRGMGDRMGPGPGRDGRSMQQVKPYPPSHPDARIGRGPPVRDPRNTRGPPYSSGNPPGDQIKSDGHLDIRRREPGRPGPPHRRYDAHGQAVIEPDDNLSDKEIYPPSHMTIPSIEITKDSASEGRHSLDNFSDEDYELGRPGMRGPPGRPPHGQYADYGRDKSRPPPDAHGRPRDRDYYDREWGHRRPAEGYADHYNSDYRGGGPHPRRAHPHDENQRARLFRAIFDYDPRTMSPNPNAADEELPFREGQIIKIYGDMDPDGFYYGESGGRKGYVPGNMVTELPVDQDQRHIPAPNRRSGTSPRRSPVSGERWGDIFANMPRRKMLALYDYDPQELSPNVDAEAELSFRTGDVIYVYGDMDEDGFFLGEVKGMRGLVPSNFLTEAPPDYRGEGRAGGRDSLAPHDANAPPPGKYHPRGPNMDRQGPGPRDGRRGPYGPSPPHEGDRGPPPRDGPPSREMMRNGPDTERPVTQQQQAPTQDKPVPVEPAPTPAKPKTTFPIPTVVSSPPTTTTAPSQGASPFSAAPKGLMAMLPSSIASKLSPAEGAGAGGGGTASSLTSVLGIRTSSNTDKSQQQQQQGEEGGMFQSLLNFAKRAT